MSSLTPTVSPLRRRMIDDMRMRKFAGKTQIHYIPAVRRLAAFLKRSPDTSTAEELRAFQLHMIDTGTASPTINSTLSGLKFFFDITLGHGELMVKRQPVHHLVSYVALPKWRRSPASREKWPRFALTRSA